MEENDLPPAKRCKPVLDDTSGIVQLVRKESPQHCILKIESFSVLQDAVTHSTKDHINSTEFKAGDYTWVLSVYPNGNKKEDGDGHLSLYVSLIEKLDNTTVANASLRFFIYDQIRDDYLTFVDVGDKRFHSLKTVWGIPKALTVETFADASNGFLVDDSCVFGAEVFLRNGQINRSIVSFLDSKCERTYTWKIEKFSDQHIDRLYSPVFSFGEWVWKLHLYPRGNEKAKGQYLSLYLVLDNAKDLTRGSNLYTRYSLCLKNQNALGADCKRIVRHWFVSESHGHGFPSMISISDLYNTVKGFLVDDTLVVKVNIEVMLVLQDMDSTPKKQIEGVDSVSSDDWAY